ncbi:MAG: M3 family peptidase, partial [Nannocystaceae bacterium]
MKDTTEKPTDASNPLLAEWSGPHGGVPAFTTMDLADLEPAMGEAIALHLQEIDAIANNSEPPTFENTIVAMEAAGKPSDRVSVYRGIWSSNLSTPEFREIDKRLAPKVSEYITTIVQNEKLFNRIKAVYE